MIIITIAFVELGNQMDKSSGLKECPRCGLRSRRGAYQCDFCGWDFKADSDDWMGQLNDLEKMGREVGTMDMDTSMRSKIELTIKRPAEIPVKERRPEPEPVAEPLNAPQDHGDVLTQTAPLPVVGAPPEMVAMDEGGTVTVAEEVKPMNDDQQVPRTLGLSRLKVGSAPEAFHTPYAVPGVVLGAGALVYAVDMLLVAYQGIGSVLGWGIAIPASGLMAYGVMRLLPVVRRLSRERETLLCPVCHQAVTEKDAKCPSCGVRFQTSSSKE